MTQKELSYIEDAIGHECNMIMIINNIIENIDDQKLITFFEKEEKKHTNIKESLISKLEEKVNE